LALLFYSRGKALRSADVLGRDTSLLVIFRSAHLDGDALERHGERIERK